MKKRLITALVVLVALLAQAQGNAGTSEHLLFKGVPIDGTLDEFIQKMKAGGFSLIASEEGLASLEGDFVSFRKCTVTVSTQKQMNLVNKISVRFPERETWSALYSDYVTLKDLLTEKYGKPSGGLEKFQNSYSLDDDNNKMYELKMDRCKYYQIFDTSKGTIQLSIEHINMSSCFVVLIYIDKLNSESVRAKALEDL